MLAISPALGGEDSGKSSINTLKMIFAFCRLRDFLLEISREGLLICITIRRNWERYRILQTALRPRLIHFMIAGAIASTLLLNLSSLTRREAWRISHFGWRKLLLKHNRGRLLLGRFPA